MKRLLIALTYFLLSFALFAYSESGGNRYLNLQDEGGITHSHPKEVKEAFPWNETQNQEGSAPYYDDVAIQNAFAAVSYDTATFCAGTTFTYGDSTFTTPGQKEVIFTIPAGEDSTVNLLLIEIQPVFHTLDSTVCNSITWNGNTHTTSGNYNDTLTAANGCDSIVTLQLTVNQTIFDTIQETACGEFT